MDEVSRTKNIISLLIIFILILILAFGIYKLFQGSRKSTPSKKKNDSITPVVRKVSPLPYAVGKGSLSFITEEKGAYVGLNEQISIIISASSDNTPVMGYDLVINFDNTMLTYISSDNRLSQNYDNKLIIAPGKITVSGMVKKDKGTPQVFGETAVEVLNFKTVKKGKSAVSFEFKGGSTDDSNLISSNSVDVLGKVSEPLIVHAGDMVRLKLNETKPIGNTGLYLRLDKVTVPADSCRDCFTSQDLTVLNSQRASIGTFGFRSGGFAGRIYDEAKAGGYDFKLFESGKTDITVLAVTE